MPKKKKSMQLKLPVPLPQPRLPVQSARHAWRLLAGIGPEVLAQLARQRRAPAVARSPCWVDARSQTLPKDRGRTSPRGLAALLGAATFHFSRLPKHRVPCYRAQHPGARGCPGHATGYGTKCWKVTSCSQLSTAEGPQSGALALLAPLGVTPAPLAELGPTSEEALALVSGLVQAK